MKFLVDECLSVELADRLRAAGHDAVHVGDLDLLGRPDADIMRAALPDGRVVLSADTDFGELLALGGARQPSVVLFRRVGRRARDQAELLLANVAAVELDLRNGALVVLQQDTMRVRLLPIHPHC